MRSATSTARSPSQQRAERLARETNQREVEAWGAAYIANIAAMRGQTPRAYEFLARTQRLGVPLTSIGNTGVTWVLAAIHLAAGDAESTIEALEGDTDFAFAVAYPSPWTTAFDLAEAYVRADRPALAERAVDTLAVHARQPWALASLARVRGLMAESEFDEHLQESIDGFARLSLSFEEGRSRLCYGERLRRAGRRVDARRQLRDALATFERLRTEPWAARTRAELRASGETLRARSASTGIDELTPQELQVALTVSAGMTNKEAAAQLFLSTKTIEAHLHRTYRKLGISSRQELRPLLADKQPIAPTHSTASGSIRQARRPCGTRRRRARSPSTDATTSAAGQSACASKTPLRPHLLPGNGAVSAHRFDRPRWCVGRGSAAADVSQRTSTGWGESSERYATLRGRFGGSLISELAVCREKW